jgi:hypothetical protein
VPKHSYRVNITGFPFSSRAAILRISTTVAATKLIARSS